MRPPEERGAAPPVERGVAASARSRTVRRRSEPAQVAGVLFVALVIVLVADVLATQGRHPSATPSQSPGPTPTNAAVIPPATSVSPPTPTASPVATASPTAPASPSPTLFLITPSPAPTPTVAITLPPTPAPTPRPTAAPTPTPALFAIKQKIEDDAFTGDYNGSGSGTYHGRTATWIYGQGTPYSTMTAKFQLDRTGSATGDATLKIVGLEGSDPAKETIKVVLNGTTIYKGTDPLPNDFTSGPSGPGNWGTATFTFSSDLLKRDNELSITNLTQSSCTLCSDFVMVDYVLIGYSVTL